MKNNGKSDYSIKFVDKSLTYISKNVNLNEPEQVKQFIANVNGKNGYKTLIELGCKPTERQRQRKTKHLQI